MLMIVQRRNLMNSTKIENDKVFMVYKHTSPSGKVYIGITSKTKPEQRWKSGKGYKKQSLFWKAIQKYGWGSFKHDILFTNLSKKDACNKEIELIKQYKSNNPEYGYNICIGGELSQFGIPCSDEKRAKISKSLQGFKASEETRKKLSAIRKGRKFSKSHKLKLSQNNAMKKQEYRDKVSQALKGRKFSDETKKRMSLARSDISGENNPMYGKHHSEETRRKIARNKSCPNAIPVICIETEQTFSSQASAAQHFGISVSTIHNSVITGKTCKIGYTFKKLNTIIQKIEI